MTKEHTSQRQIHIETSPLDRGVRLDKLLSKKIPDISRTRLKELIKEGLVTLNGRVCLVPRHKVAGVERIKVTLPRPAPLEVEPRAMELEIIYEDEFVVALNKPAGLVVHPGAGNPDNTLVHGLLYHCTNLSGIGGKIRPGIVHRLDKDTSGVIIVAKNDRAHHALVDIFKKRSVKKSYMAIVSGALPDRQGIIDLPVGRHPVKRTKMAVVKNRGKEAVTQFQVERKLFSAQLVRLRLHTGRTHQIRVHMAHLGHPLLGDRLYGGPGTITGPSGEKIEIPRQMLHARRLQLEHPVISGKRLNLVAKVPQDMENVITRLSAG